MIFSEVSLSGFGIGVTAGLRVTWEGSHRFCSLEEAAGVLSSFTTVKDREDSLVRLGPDLAPCTEQFRGDGRRSRGKAPRGLTREAQGSIPGQQEVQEGSGGTRAGPTACSLRGNTW